MALHKDIIERANARVGQVLKGKWRLDAVIGIGGMASVYAATHRNQARAAIKLLHPEVALDAEVTARFLREGYVANAVGHPGTVTVLDDDVSEDHAPFLVMELLIGQTLDTMLALAPSGLVVAEVMPLLIQLLDVLAAAHDKGIVHRDLKPENLFLTSEGRLKVLDFGIARLRELSAQTPSATRAGSVLGTPAFMAPEQALGRWNEVDGRTDIWAVGATAFTLLTGQFVHQAETIQEQLVLSATRPARPLRELKRELPEEIARVIDRALAFAQCDRFADARSMRQALEPVVRLGMDVFTPIPPLFAQSLRVSTPAEQHGITLVAPVEVTSAITGQSEIVTGYPVTRSAVQSSAPRRRWSVLAAFGLLGVLSASLLFLVNRRGAIPAPSLGNSASAGSAPAAPDPAPEPKNTVATDHPAVAPVVEDARPRASSARPQLKRPPSVASPKPAPQLRPQLSAMPVLTSLPVITTPHVKSLVGDDNPFDRRH